MAGICQRWVRHIERAWHSCFQKPTAAGGISFRIGIARFQRLKKTCCYYHRASPCADILRAFSALPVLLDYTPSL